MTSFLSAVCGRQETPWVHPHVSYAGINRGTGNEHKAAMEHHTPRSRYTESIRKKCVLFLPGISVVCSALCGVQPHAVVVDGGLKMLRSSARDRVAGQTADKEQQLRRPDSSKKRVRLGRTHPAAFFRM